MAYYQNFSFSNIRIIELARCLIGRSPLGIGLCSLFFFLTREAQMERRAAPYPYSKMCELCELCELFVKMPPLKMSVLS